MISFITIVKYSMDVFSRMHCSANVILITIKGIFDIKKQENV
jgi:hypothetical protein